MRSAGVAGQSSIPRGKPGGEHFTHGDGVNHNLHRLVGLMLGLFNPPTAGNLIVRKC